MKVRFTFLAAYMHPMDASTPSQSIAWSLEMIATLSSVSLRHTVMFDGVV